MTAQELENWILNHYDGLIVTNAYRERSFFYNPDRSLPKGVYFATIKESHGPNDKSSNLDRDNVYRLSLGVGKKNYQELFGAIPKRPEKGEIVDLEMNFTELQKLMPHPIYAWLNWIAILSPNIENVEMIKHLFDISYEKVTHSFQKKQPITFSQLAKKA